MLPTSAWGKNSVPKCGAVVQTFRPGVPVTLHQAWRISSRRHTNAWERPLAATRAAHDDVEPEVIPPQGPHASANTPASSPAPAPPPPPATGSGGAAVESTGASVAPSASSSSSSSSSASEKSQRQRRLERLRVSLLAALSSLDRGLAANAREAAEVDELCSRLEGLGGPVALPALGAPPAAALASTGSGSTAAAAAGAAGGGGEEDLLSGTWRLVYSSGFNSGSLGGRRPGPPAALFPAVLGQVYQRIDPATAKLDNIVELLFSYGPPDLGLLGGLGGEALGRGLAGLGRQLGIQAEQLPPPLRDLVAGGSGQQGQGKAGWGQEQQKRESPAARLTLRHDYEVTSPATVRIVYEETYGQIVGSDLFAGLPRLEAPSLPEPLRPPKFLRSASFEVTFLDATLRITRGDRGELRVYLRDEAAEALLQGGGWGSASASAAMALD